jgi:hypothetical protein
MREPETMRPAANDEPVTIRIRAPHGVPVQIVERDDDGPWWSAICGAVGMNALIWILALIIMD